MDLISVLGKSTVRIIDDSKIYFALETATVNVAYTYVRRSYEQIIEISNFKVIILALAFVLL